MSRIPLAQGQSWQFLNLNVLFLPCDISYHFIVLNNFLHREKKTITIVIYWYRSKLLLQGSSTLITGPYISYVSVVVPIWTLVLPRSLRESTREPMLCVGFLLARVSKRGRVFFFPSNHVLTRGRRFNFRFRFTNWQDFLLFEYHHVLNKKMSDWWLTTTCIFITKFMRMNKQKQSTRDSESN